MYMKTIGLVCVIFCFASVCPAQATKDYSNVTGTWMGRYFGTPAKAGGREIFTHIWVEEGAIRSVIAYRPYVAFASVSLENEQFSMEFETLWGRVRFLGTLDNDRSNFRWSRNTNEGTGFLERSKEPLHPPDVKPKSGVYSGKLYRPEIEVVFNFEGEVPSAVVKLALGDVSLSGRWLDASSFLLATEADDVPGMVVGIVRDESIMLFFEYGPIGGEGTFTYGPLSVEARLTGVIWKALPGSANSRLRAAMLEALIEYRPVNRSEYLESMPPYLRESIVESESEFLEGVFDIINASSEAHLVTLQTRD